MPYETTITGEFAIHPPLAAAHLAYLLAFSRTRHMRRATRALKKRPDPLREAAGLPLGRGGAYYVGGLDLLTQSLATVTNSLKPPHGQPGLYCKWTPTADGRALVWQGSGSHYEEWLEDRPGYPRIRALAVNCKASGRIVRNRSPPVLPNSTSLICTEPVSHPGGIRSSHEQPHPYW